MDGKKAFSIIAVAMLAFCSLMVVAYATETVADDEKEKAFLLDFEEADYTKLKVVVADHPAEIILGEGFGISVDEIINGSSFGFNVTLNKTAYSIGIKSVNDEGRFVMEQVTRLSTEFDIKLSALDDAKLSFTEEYFISGEGYEEYKSLMNTTFKKGDVIEFSGRFVFEDHTEYVIEAFKNSSSEYLVEKSSLRNYYKVDLDSFIKFKDRQFEVDMSRALAYGWQMEYLFDVDDLNKVKPGDECRMSVKTNIDACTISQSIRVDGVKKDIKVDMVEYKKGLVMSGEYPTNVYFMGEMEIEYYKVTLELFEAYAMNPELYRKSESEINRIVTENGGSFSTDVADYNEEAERIDNDVYKGNDSTLWIIIGVVLALIAIIGILCFVKFRD